MAYVVDGRDGPAHVMPCHGMPVTDPYEYGRMSMSLVAQSLRGQMLLPICHCGGVHSAPSMMMMMMPPMIMASGVHVCFRAHERASACHVFLCLPEPACALRTPPLPLF